MAQISRFLRSSEGGGLLYWCQGCDSLHRVTVGDGAGPRWGYNGNPDKPTFTPSVLTTFEHSHPPVTSENLEQFKAAPWPQERRKAVCHTFITDGMVQFLGDCTHPFAGQTLPLPELPEWLRDPEPAS